MELRPNEPLDLRMAKAVAVVLRESKLPRDAFLQIQFLVKIQSDGQVQVSEMVATEHPRPEAAPEDRRASAWRPPDLRRRITIEDFDQITKLRKRRPGE